MGKHTSDRVPAWGGANAGPIAVAVAMCAACLVTLAWLRAGWLDEYWTIWYTDPANPLSVAYHARWLRDTQHPPTFYALGWTLAPLIGDDLASRRLLINGLALIWIVPTILACRRDHVSPQQPPLYLLMMIAGPFLVTYFAEYRSYFLGLSATACLVAVTRRLHLDLTSGRHLSLPRVALFCLLAVIAGNLHYTMSLCAFAFLGVTCLWHWFRGSRAFAIVVAATVSVALIPLTLNLLAALAVASPTPVVHQGLVQGWTIIALVVVSVPISNLVMTYLAARTLRAPHAIAPDTTSIILVLAVSLAIIVAGFLVMHVLTHNTFPRLVLGLIPVATALVCELAAQRPIGRTALLLICANAIVVAGGTVVGQLRKPRWEQAVPTIRAAIAACPSTRVVAVSPLRLAYRPSNMTGQGDAMALGYRTIAHKYGFPVVVVTDGPPATRDAASRCPTLVWLEHNFARPDLTATQLYAAALAGPLPAGDRLQMTRQDEHFLLSAKP